ncbi:MAG: hypothetical protein EBT06_10140 [Gammaproteobacteria bacterium]|nr:hypothetical protein [Gammaproteobacteria bacterium]NBT45261.1 hypothetical protein [Gammaproteobacteria bacterium]NBY21571.1 hypothetical protein [Gammaproteobacteria bacterium]NDE33681.1 hypothetical protein [Gammaproteobacteria bacterium]NDE55670.1 hypothetical protein [Gammaproteobacteria bacterium]
MSALESDPKKKNLKVSKEQSHQEHLEALKAIEHLPRDVGWLLLVTGLLSEVGMPGVPPFWIFGILILWPEMGVKVTRPIHRRFPSAFGGALQLVNRFADDLDARYPPKTAPLVNPEEVKVLRRAKILKDPG